jgi:hypothetical protein
MIAQRRRGAAAVLVRRLFRRAEALGKIVNGALLSRLRV